MVALAPETMTKKPAEIIIRNMNFSQKMFDGERIVAIEDYIVDPQGLVILYIAEPDPLDPNDDPQSVQVALSGGNDNVCYLIRINVMTDKGQTLVGLGRCALPPTVTQ